jgi:hypothetical protein
VTVIDTVGAVLGFLGLVAPGLVFELARGRRRPHTAESAFREAARIALTSLVFTSSSLAVLAIVRALEPRWLPDPGEWLRRGDAYLEDHYALVMVGLLLQVAVACCLAGLTHWALRRWGMGRADIRPGSVWYQVLRQDRPESKDLVWLHLRLTDGTRAVGALRHYTSDDQSEHQMIALGGAGLEIALPNGDYTPFGRDFDFVTFRSDRIAFMAGVYIDERRSLFVRRNGQPVRFIPPARGTTPDTGRGSGSSHPTSGQEGRIDVDPSAREGAGFTVVGGRPGRKEDPADPDRHR